MFSFSHRRCFVGRGNYIILCNNTFFRKMYFPILLYLVASEVSAIHDKSEDRERKGDSTRRLEYLKTYLPKSYYCCKDGQNLDISKWHLESSVHSNTTCVDESGTHSEISLICDRVINLDANLEDYDSMEFYVEDNIVYIGDHELFKIETTVQKVCFGNATSPRTKEVSLMALICFVDGPDFEEYTGADSVTAGKLSIISLPFVVLTIMVYALLPELRDLQGLSILSLCSTYAIFLIMMANATLNIRFRINESMCHAGGLITYYSIISSFVWMNAIAIQVFVSIRFPKLTMSWSKQFKWYSLYAWGVPGLLLFCVMLADVAPGKHILPGMGMNYDCWFNSRAARWAYYLAPMTLILSCNVLMFLASVVLLFRQKSGPDYKKLRYKFLISLRLFLVVGITWLTDPLQMAHGKKHVAWVIADCWNFLQGVIMFLVLVVLRKRAVLGLLSRGFLFCLTPYLQAWSDRLADEEQKIVDNGALEASVYRKGDGKEDYV